MGARFKAVEELSGLRGEYPIPASMHAGRVQVRVSDRQGTYRTPAVKFTAVTVYGMVCTVQPYLNNT